MPPSTPPTLPRAPRVAVIRASVRIALCSSISPRARAPPSTPPQPAAGPLPALPRSLSPPRPIPSSASSPAFSLCPRLPPPLSAPHTPAPPPPFVLKSSDTLLDAAPPRPCGPPHFPVPPDLASPHPACPPYLRPTRPVPRHLGTFPQGSPYLGYRLPRVPPAHPPPSLPTHPFSLISSPVSPSPPLPLLALPPPPLRPVASHTPAPPTLRGLRLPRARAPHRNARTTAPPSPSSFRASYTRLALICSWSHPHRPRLPQATVTPPAQPLIRSPGGCAPADARPPRPPPPPRPGPPCRATSRAHLSASSRRKPLTHS